VPIDFRWRLPLVPDPKIPRKTSLPKTKSTYNRSAGGRRHDRKCPTGRKPDSPVRTNGPRAAVRPGMELFLLRLVFSGALWPELSDTDDRASVTQMPTPAWSCELLSAGGRLRLGRRLRG
jgi:hypothetical protein